MPAVVEAGPDVQGRVVVLRRKQLAVVVHGQKRSREEHGCPRLLQTLAQVVARVHAIDLEPPATVCVPTEERDVSDLGSLQGAQKCADREARVPQGKEELD